MLTTATPRPASFPGPVSTACRALLLALLPLVAGVGPAAASDLAAFLERAERMGTANDKVEADVTIREADGTTRTGYLLIDPAGGGSLVYEDKATGWKSESPLDWKDGKATPKAGAASGPLAPDAPIAGTDLRAIDFFPFWKTDYAKAFTSDENTNERTVSLYADKGRPYSLYVITFDKTHLVPQMVKFYRDTFNNLVRIRTDKGWKMVGSRPRPADILVKDFAGNTMRTYALEWRVVGQ